MNNTEYCVMCGVEIPEGRQVCRPCQDKIRKMKIRVGNRYTDYIARGDVFFADLNPVVGSETGGIRPVVIIQNDAGNRCSTTVIAAITSRAKKQDLPVHVAVSESIGGLTEDTTILLEQIRTIDKRRLKRYIGHLDDETMKRVDAAALKSIGLDAGDDEDWTEEDDNAV